MPGELGVLLIFHETLSRRVLGQVRNTGTALTFGGVLQRAIFEYSTQDRHLPVNGRGRCPFAASLIDVAVELRKIRTPRAMVGEFSAQKAPKSSGKRVLVRESTKTGQNGGAEGPGLRGGAEVSVYAESPLIPQPFRNVEPISIFRSHHLLSSAEKTQVSTVSRSCLTCSSNSVRRIEAGGMRRPQLGLPRLLGMKVGPRPILLRPTRIGDWNDGRASDCMKKAPERVRGLDQFWMCAEIRRRRFGTS